LIRGKPQPIKTWERDGLPGSHQDVQPAGLPGTGAAHRPGTYAQPCWTGLATV